MHYVYPLFIICFLRSIFLRTGEPEGPDKTASARRLRVVFVVCTSRKGPLSIPQPRLAASDGIVIRLKFCIISLEEAQFPAENFFMPALDRFQESAALTASILTFSNLGKIFSRRHLEIVSYFTQRKRI